MNVLLLPPAPFVFGAVVVIAWHLRRQRMGWLRRKPDYVWAFVHGGIIYVMATMLSAHYFEDMSYSRILQRGFGEIQVSIAFIGALFEGYWSLWDLWNGEGSSPAPGG